VQITFANSRLGRSLKDERSRHRKYGPERAKKLRVRLSTLKAAANLEELRNVPGRFHELTANRTGQIAASLDGSCRLVFTPVIAEEDVHYHEEGLDWTRVTAVEIQSIEDYHG